MDGHAVKLASLYEDDIQPILQNVVEYMMLVSLIIQGVFQIDRLLHLFFLLWLPEPAHPKLSDVLPSPACDLNYPLVAIQLPMMDEIECCESAIECACNLEWPKSRLLVQVLDDSMKKHTRLIIDRCVQKWAERGVEINVHRRQNRHGFKAGNLNAGMSFIGEAEYVVIFDVDFLPTKDYLSQMVPLLIQDSTLAFVQARWTFTNGKETLLTRMQEIALNFHHKCEQESRSRASLFFTFNGTGGVWRTSAIEQLGGWDTDSLVEDLDLSLRAYLKGWGAIYRHDVECLSELPSSMSAYFSQQHRWTKGPMQVAKKMVAAVYQTRHLRWYKKLYCIWYLARSGAHLFTFISLLIFTPLTIVLPDTHNYILISICFSIITNFCFATFTFDEIHPILILTPFMDAMSLHYGCATISGLFNYGQAKQWIVTPKSGFNSTEVFVAITLDEESSSKSKRDKNNNQVYSYLSVFSRFLIKHHFRWTYQRVRQIFREFLRNKRYSLMAIYLLLALYVAYENGAYLTVLYLFPTTIMYFAFASGCIGNQTEGSPNMV